jgi:hypothetical protein
MLSSFIVKRHYCGLSVSIIVDCETRESSVTMSYNRRLAVVSAPIPFADTDTPAKANSWLSRPSGVHGSFLESMHWQAKHGVGAFAPAIPAAA